MNKKGQNTVIILLIGIALAFFVIYFAMDRIEKQIPHDIDITNDEGGTLTVRMRDEKGDTGEMLKDFYKVTGVIGSVIRGTTSVSCTTNQNCIDRCQGNSFCLSHIQCYQDKCTYGPGASGIEITQIALDAGGINTGDTILDVTFDSATTSPASTAFGSSHSGNLGVTKEASAGQTAVFPGTFFDLVGYQTGSPTAFTVSLHAVDQFDGTRYPASGSLTSSVNLVISPDPTGGFSVAISQLPGI